MLESAKKSMKMKNNHKKYVPVVLSKSKVKAKKGLAKYPWQTKVREKNGAPVVLSKNKVEQEMI